MANILVVGLPWPKHLRAKVRRRLREEASKYGTVVGVTWGNRKGTAFVAMDSPFAASKVIHEVKRAAQFSIRREPPVKKTFFFIV